MRDRSYLLLQNIINSLLGLAAFFIGLRIVFKLFSINQATPFVSFINAISNVLIVPFAGISPNIALRTGVLDMVALIALLAYALLAFLVTNFFRSYFIKGPERIVTTSHYHDIDRDRPRRERIIREEDKLDPYEEDRFR